MSALTGPVRLAEFVFDPDTGELTGPAGTVRLQPQPALVLRTLVGRAGRLVTRDELKGIVWPDTVVESDQGLNYCVRQIRSAFGDEAESSRFIETLPRRGYRFIGPVAPREPDTKSRTDLAPGRDDPPAFAPPVAGPRTRRAGVVGLAAAFAVAAMVIVLSRPNRTRLAEPRTVAVLPLTTPNADEWATRINQQVGDRLVEHLTNSESPRWSVIGPVTTGAYATDPRPHTELGALLGASYVLSGGVRLADSTLFVQAVRARDGSHVFAWRGKTAGRSTDSVFRDLAAALTQRAEVW